MLNLCESNALVVGLCVGMGVPILIVRSIQLAQMIALLCPVAAMPSGLSGALIAVTLYQRWMGRGNA